VNRIKHKCPKASIFPLALDLLVTIPMAGPNTNSGKTGLRSGIRMNAGTTLLHSEELLERGSRT
jgi:hypothetical protein